PHALLQALLEQALLPELAGLVVVHPLAILFVVDEQAHAAELAVGVPVAPATVAKPCTERPFLVLLAGGGVPGPHAVLQAHLVPARHVHLPIAEPYPIGAFQLPLAPGLFLLGLVIAVPIRPRAILDTSAPCAPGLGIAGGIVLGVGA